ncbi:MAG: hypothetical protein IJ641_02975 [Lachnospiraceae bacterium]|nr:hypothetical protein [Lachnospiraceae bacterium]
MNTFQDSKESILIKKKEAELREVKRKENERRREFETEMKCIIGGTFHKYFNDAYLFDKYEWDRIIGELVKTDTFTNVVRAIYSENMTPNSGKAVFQKNNPASVKTPAKVKPVRASGEALETNGYTEEYSGESGSDVVSDRDAIYSPYKD